MKQILFLIAIAISAHAMGQQHIVTYWDAFKQYKQEVYDLNKNGEKNGKYVAYFSDGSINAERVYKDGQLNGRETIYYNDETGRGLAHIYNYKNDKQDGLQQSYIEPKSGEYYFKYVRTEEFYKDGEMQWRKTYNTDKTNKRYLMKDEEYRYNGFAWALYLTKGYEPNGHQYYQMTADGFNWQEADGNQNKIEFHSKNGERDGVYKEWLPNGVCKQTFYIEGQAFAPIDSSKTTVDSDGNFKMFNIDGKVVIEGKRINNKLTGEYKVFFDDGGLFKDCFYKDGNLDSICKIWAEGCCLPSNNAEWYVPKSVCFYKDGKLNGPCKIYFGKEGIEHGYGPTKLKSECNYTDGKLDGEFIEYGSVYDKKILYKNGVAIRRWAKYSDAMNQHDNWMEKSLDDSHYLTNGK